MSPLHVPALAGAGSIGIFGGTFDPVHIGHLILAERAREELELDGVLFVPASIPPHKRDGRAITPASCRLEMLELAISSNEAFHHSSHEIERKGISYTDDTLTSLRSGHPGARLTLLIGGDNAREFATWRNPETIASLAGIAVWARPGTELPEEILPGVGYRRIDAPLLQISSTEIRRRVASGKSIRYLTPAAVADYILQHGLYRQS